jgi:hypothetical protein
MAATKKKNTPMRNDPAEAMILSAVARASPRTTRFWKIERLAMPASMAFTSNPSPPAMAAVRSDMSVDREASSSVFILLSSSSGQSDLS